MTRLQCRLSVAGTAVLSTFLVGALLAACGGPPSSTAAGGQSTGPTTTAGSGAGSTSGTGSGVTRWSGTPVSATAIPLGDGKVTTTSPKVGYVYSCTSQFKGGGARHSGSWINTAAGTYNSTTKPHVEGSNSWPNASHSFTVSGSTRILKTNDLPTGATTGNFPISPSDPAYQYDTNPNHVAAQSFDWSVPANPTAASSPGCLGLGPIGVSTDGVLFFDALDAAGRDAGAHEIQDSCNGHPQGSNIYHYHTYSPCLATTASKAAGSSVLVGYALDGYGIYVERDAQGNLPTDADLGQCHGRTSAVTWDGRRVVMYHYDVTLEYPYTVGCYHGTPVQTHTGGGGTTAGTGGNSNATGGSGAGSGSSLPPQKPRRAPAP